MNKKGFTLVELLVVLLIIAILAAIATPLYLQNAQRARASEAVAHMSLIRQALREKYINTNSYGGDIAKGSVDAPLASNGLNVSAGVAQYFSNGAYEVITTTPSFSTGTPGDPTTPVDFLVRADGRFTEQCASGDTDCAVKYAQVKGAGSGSSTCDTTPSNLGNCAGAYILEMDNSGRIFVSYDNGGTWDQY